MFLATLVGILVASCAAGTPASEPTTSLIFTTPVPVPPSPTMPSGVRPDLTGGSQARRSMELDSVDTLALLSEAPPSEALPSEALPSEAPLPEASLSVVSLDAGGPTELPQFDATTYTVQPGDTLLGIAFEYAVPLAALQLANGLGDSFLIRAGAELAIPAYRDWAHASRFWIVYLVAPGEIAGVLAARYGLSLSDLEAANPGLDVDRLSIGQALVLPLDGPAELIASENRARQGQALAAVQPPPAPVLPADTPAEPAADTPAEPAAAAPADPALAPPAAAAPPPAAVPPPASADTPVDVAGLPAEIFRLVNEQRAAYGLAPLAWNETLARAAQRHANDCYARGYCSHTGSDGSTYKERIIREGYNPVRWSECWAWYGTAVRAVAMWMDEVPPNDPHRRTILNPELTEVGVGVVPGNGFGYYFIADFGKPR